MRRRLAKTETIYIQLDGKPKEASVFPTVRNYRRKLRAFLFVLMSDVNKFTSSSPDFFSPTFYKYVDKFGFDKLALLSAFTTAYTHTKLHKEDLNISGKEMVVLLETISPCLDCHQLETSLVDVEFNGNVVSLKYNHFELVDQLKKYSYILPQWYWQLTKPKI